MRVETEAPVIRLADYRPPPFLVETVDLHVRLAPKATRVTARMEMRPNPASSEDGPQDLVLDGRGLTLVSAAIDGAPLDPSAVARDAEGLRVPAAALPGGAFVWEAVTEIDPGANTALEGLYMSRDMYCTQCEAQGFRKITFYPDRPDVMARFRVRIEGDAPVLLSNGNLVGSGPGWAEWEDPHPKPAYLFALIAGDLRAVEDRFTTRSGRDVLLQVWVRPGDEDRCTYAMDALKRAMAWDERAYGREYDLDRFMIVAVDDFNMGAMENKGLNVFNSKYVLASPETATDTDYAFIESIVAHEYFHNWTGNRITCRDWFQLCLKEGLTVFRDQQFSSDARSAGVKRIEDVIRLRAQQFREDAGPLAHPVRPASYIEINNFYTATVYEKGAELVGMLRRLVGAETYARALDLYFERHDGQACTVEDWLRVFEDTSGRDLSQFARWYAQAGTPRLRIDEDWDGTRFRVTVSQRTDPTPGQPDKAPLVIPLAYGLLGSDGREFASGVVEIDGAAAVHAWTLPERPVASWLRGFSAPVILERTPAPGERAFLIAHDTDPFNKWEAGRAEALQALERRASGTVAATEAEYGAALVALAADDRLDPAFKALALGLPTVEEAIVHVAGTGATPDPAAISAARRDLEASLARAFGDRLDALYAETRVEGAFRPDATDAGLRALRSRALALLTARDGDISAASAHFAGAGNMTDRMAALGLLVDHDAAEAALAEFRAAWRDDRLVMDKWFAVQASRTPPERAAETVDALTRAPDFDWKNPNRFRALIAAFASQNPAGFHRADGAGYRLVADWLIRLDPVNPQTAARLTGAFGTWRMFDPDRQAMMRGELNRIGNTAGLSRDTSEMIGRLLHRNGG